MGKYAKKPKTTKTQAIATRQTVKKKTAKGKKAKGRKAAASKKALGKFAARREAADEDEVQQPAGDDAEMGSTPAAAGQDAATSQAGAKLVSFLSRAKSENKAQDALQKILNAPTKHEPAALGAALVHCAGRGLGNCVRALLEAGAPADSREPAAQGGRTALQLACSRGHVIPCRLLVEAGADRSGAAEAAQALTKMGATFAQERQAILAALK